MVNRFDVKWNNYTDILVFVLELSAVIKLMSDSKKMTFLNY